jgi:hypothetical protein
MTNYQPSFDPNAIDFEPEPPKHSAGVRFLNSKWFYYPAATAMIVTGLAFMCQQFYILGINRGNEIYARSASAMLSSINKHYCAALSLEKQDAQAP